jgi:hypothetical protein
MGAFHRGDGCRNFDGSSIAVGQNKSAEELPIPLYYWPNSQNVDRDGDGVNDYTWQNIQMKNNNPNDLAVNNTFNYEVGMALYNRVKYQGPDGAWRYIYYLPYRPVEGEMFGPYAGRVMSSGEKGGDDPYDVTDAAARDTYDAFYKPIVFPESFKYRGVTYKPKGLIDEIYDYDDAGVEVQANLDDLERNYGFKHVAGINVKWDRECVQGITVGNTANPTIAIPPGTMLLPTGFSAAKLQATKREGNFEAEYDSNEGGDKSLMGTLKEGDDARDSFFKINAADCCNNDVVIASGTYGTEDNFKPIPKLVVREMETQHSSGDLYFDVATIPNDKTGAGEPLDDYDPDRVYTKIHSGVPIYNDPVDQPGVQGEQIRGYGNYSNNASVWNGMAQLRTMQNPADQSNRYSFLRMRYYDNEPPFQEDRRYEITVSADDNISPSVKLPSVTDPDGSVSWPIRHLSYRLYHHPSDENAAVDQVFEGEYDQVSQQVNQALVSGGFEEVVKGTVVHIEYGAPEDQWQREPVETFPYTFKSSGRWIARVDAVDRSNNGRIMLVPLDVGQVGIKTRGIDMDTQRID